MGEKKKVLQQKLIFFYVIWGFRIHGKDDDDDYSQLGIYHEIYCLEFKASSTLSMLLLQ